MALTPPGYAQGRRPVRREQGQAVARRRHGQGRQGRQGDRRRHRLAACCPHGVDALGVAVDPKDGSSTSASARRTSPTPYLDRHGRQGAATTSRASAARSCASRPTSASARSSAPASASPSAWRSTPHGDLFATDQEGATWVPNGNPFDELLHIQPGRHYGFPPRHPKHLPERHRRAERVRLRARSTSPPAAWSSTSPSTAARSSARTHWRGDAIVTGYSRGKLYRTQLVKTPAGYVAQNHLLASHDDDARRRVRLAGRRPRRRRARRQARLGQRPGGQGRAVQDRLRRPPTAARSRCSRTPPGRARCASRSTGRSTRRRCTGLAQARVDRVRRGRRARATGSRSCGRATRS